MGSQTLLPALFLVRHSEPKTCAASYLNKEARRLEPVRSNEYSGVRSFSLYEKDTKHF